MIKTAKVVSSGTHKYEDLLPAFADELYDRLGSHEEVTRISEIEIIWEAYDIIEQGEFEHYEVPFILQDLRYALEMHAPRGYYFGTMEGDGACFGFFPIEENSDG